MSPPIIPFQRARYGEATERAVLDVLRSGRTGGGGPFGDDVERLLTAQTGARHALLVTSCTHAMEAALMALGVGPGDEVIVPGFLYVSSVIAVARQGARPVFVDVERERLGLDPEGLEAAIGPRTRAIFPVHYAGVACRLDEILAIAAGHGVPVIEDAAQAIGSTLGGRALGTLGLTGFLSFHETKNVGCGEGGALLTSDDRLAARVEQIRDKGTNRAACVRGEVPHYTWVSHGSSFALSELSAAVLASELPRLAELNAARASVAGCYLEALAPLADRGRLELPAAALPGVSLNWHVFHVLLARDVDRAAVQARMAAAGVQTAAHFQPLQRSPFYLGLSDDEPPELPVTEDVCGRILRLPIYPGLEPDDVARVTAALADALGGA